MTETAAPFEPHPAYTELHALACAMRPDWSRDDLRDAMTAAHNANWPWKDLYREVMRLVWTEEETPATLRSTARKPRAAPAAPLDPDVKAALFADLASRRTGPQKALTPENDPRAATSPATEATNPRR